MFYKIKRFIRNHERVMCILSAIYQFFGFNRVKGRTKNEISLKGCFLNHSKVLCYGKNNIIEIEKGCRLYECKILVFGDGNTVHISHDCELKKSDLHVSGGGILEIGHNTYFSGKVHIACIEGTKVHIGERCLFSDEIVFRTGDSHSILDDKGERINPSQDINIGNHVWIGQQVIVLKGADIADETIVGTRTLVTGKKYKRNVVLAGTPAKEIKQGVTWNHELI